MVDRIVTTSSKGLGSRLMESIKGVAVGLVMFLIAFPVLFWNEGRAVKDYKTIQEGLGITVSVAADEVDAANDGKLVHLNGLATTTEELSDGQFGITVNAIRLRRNVEMYQWVESKEERTRTELGGKEVTETIYEYRLQWSNNLVDSSDFEEPKGHSNPKQMRFNSKEWVASRVTVGNFTLSDSLKSKISKDEPVNMTEVPRSLRSRASVMGDGLFYGSNAADPELGDLRINFVKTPPTDVTVVAVQQGESFGPYHAETGGTIEWLKMGRLTLDGVFKAKEKEAKILTWILRLVGFMLMFVGISMIFKPLSVAADIVPIVGSILRMGTGLLGFAIAAPLTLITIGIAWVVYRPVLGVLLLVVAVGTIVGIFVLAAKRKKAAAPD